MKMYLGFIKAFKDILDDSKKSDRHKEGKNKKNDWYKKKNRDNKTFKSQTNIKKQNKANKKYKGR